MKLTQSLFTPSLRCHHKELKSVSLFAFCLAISLPLQCLLACSACQQLTQVWQLAIIRLP
jgi:hypothetical protein